MIHSSAYIFLSLSLSSSVSLSLILFLWPVNVLRGCRAWPCDVWSSEKEKEKKEQNGLFAFRRNKYVLSTWICNYESCNWQLLSSLLMARRRLFMWNQAYRDLNIHIDLHASWPNLRLEACRVLMPHSFPLYILLFKFKPREDAWPQQYICLVG